MTVEDLIEELDAIAKYCRETQNSGMFQQDFLASSGNSATSIDRFQLATFARQYKTLASSLQVQISKVVVVASKIPVPKDSKSVTRRFFELYQRLLDVADSFPSQFGRYCKRLIMQRCNQLNKDVLQLTTEFAENMRNIGNVMSSSSNSIDMEPMRCDLMKSLLKVSGHVIYHCDLICQSEPLDNKTAVLQKFRYLIECFDDVSSEIEERINQGDDSDPQDDRDDEEEEDETRETHLESVPIPPIDSDPISEEHEPIFEEDVELDPMHEFHVKLSESERSLTSTERDVAEKVERLISSASLLLRKIVTRTIAEQTSESRVEDIKWLDELASHTAAVPAILDELGSECHPPQSLENIARQTRLFAELMNTFLELSRYRTHKEKHVQWFDQWEEQFNLKLGQVLDLAPMR